MLVSFQKGRFLTLSFCLTAVAGLAGAQQVLHVPGDYSNIQTAINAASNGDTVMVADGVYSGASNRNLRLWGKAITVRSAHGPATTTIDCGSSGRGFEIRDGEGRDTIIEGFTVQNCVATGIGTDDGAGFYILYAAPTIRDCVVRYSQADGDGAGMYAFSAGPTGLDRVLVEGCTFFANWSYGDGGGLWAWGAVVVGTDFTSNQAGRSNEAGSGEGGGASLANTEIFGTRFVDNHARRGGGLKMVSNVQLWNALFQGNAADIVGGGYTQGGAIMVGGASCQVNLATMSGNWAASPAPPGDTVGHTLFLADWNADISASILWDFVSSTAIAGTGIPNINFSDVMQSTGVYPGVLNMNQDPLFVSGPTGSHYLSQIAAGQGSTSGCVDHHVVEGNLYCKVEIGDVCLDDLTTRTDQVPDSGWADIGYHYGRPHIFGCDFEIGRLSDWSTWTPM